MNASSPASPAAASWETQIRALEEQARAAFLKADLALLTQLWSDRFAVNSPLQRIMEKQPLLEALRTGRIRHLSCEVEIEYLQRHGDTVVVMGRDQVIDPPENILSHRRFTNIWQLEGATWRSIARHAHVVSREPAPARA